MQIIGPARAHLVSCRFADAKCEISVVSLWQRVAGNEAPPQICMQGECPKSPPPPQWKDTPHMRCLIQVGRPHRKKGSHPQRPEANGQIEA